MPVETAIKGPRAALHSSLLFSGALICIIFFLYGCGSPSIRTDLETLLRNPQEYDGKQVILTTTMKHLYENVDAYLYHRIEVSGFVQYRESWVGRYWNFTLTEGEEEPSLYCYEKRYGADVWILPLNAVRQAVYHNKQLTVVGRFQKGMTLELDWIEYDGQQIYTDFLPPASPGISW